MKIVCASLLIWVTASAIATADPSIADVQQALKDQGFYYGSITGQKDGDTTAAIRRYQIRNGLQISGNLDEETLGSIKSTRTAASQSPAVSAQPAPPPATSPETSDLGADAGAVRPVNPPAPPQYQNPADGEQWQHPPLGRPVPSGSGLFSGTPYETAPPGVQRRVIIDAQRILAHRGLFKNEIDGAYGSNLEFSLRAYQSRIGLPTTGRLDLETLAALQLLPGSHLPIFTPHRPAVPPEQPLRGEWVRP
ncbi:MAG TPA: peptidoglycan-binding protein [Chthoniobacterales bacterium]|jgi:peptidoglycan hydrolase-like protein with peptidoglycan-binding domain